jgi:hypothetical protein
MKSKILKPVVELLTRLLIIKTSDDELKQLEMKIDKIRNITFKTH